MILMIPLFKLTPSLKTDEILHKSDISTTIIDISKWIQALK